MGWGGVRLSPLHQARMVMSVGQSVECLAGAAEVLAGNLPHCRFVHYKSHMTGPGSNQDRSDGKPETNRLSYAPTNQK
jgi:hypothetical protein